MRKVDGYPNYDQSAFQEPSPISNSEDQILAIANSQHKLTEFLDKKNFKTYEELARKLASVLEGSNSAPSAASISDDDEPVRQVKATTQKAKVSIASSDDSDEEALSYFKKIAMEE
jgi:hypothetical protein